MENRRRRMPTNRTHTIITRAEIVSCWIVHEAVEVMLLASLFHHVKLVELYTVQGKRPPAMFRHGRRSCAAACQITRADVVINDVCMVVFGSIALAFTSCPRVVTLTTLQTAVVFIYAHDFRAVRTVQAARQTATAVVFSCELVSCGNVGILCCR